MKEEWRQLLDKELALLENASHILQRSFKVCQKIGLKENYTFEELDHFEALTSRFARLSDILIQKVLRLIDELDLETPGTVRDRINRAEKKEIVLDGEALTKIRLLRNSISHEYATDAIFELFQSVMEFTPELLNTTLRVRKYCDKQYPKQS